MRGGDDVEAIEMVVRTSVHRIGSIVLEKMLNVEGGRSEKRMIECECGGNMYISMDGTGVPVVKSEREGRKGK